MNPEQKKRFEELWDKGDYRGGSVAQRLVPRILNYVPKGKTLNDYGSGTGRAEVEILKHRPEQKINMVDIADNALEDECKNLLSQSPNLTFKIADLVDLGDFPHADWGICIGVLMTVPHETLDTILGEIRRTCDNLFMEIYDLPDNRLGSDQTLTKMNGEQWSAKLSQFWPKVLQEPSPESPQRYIFICYGSLNGRVIQLKDKYKDETCYIVGRGVSLIQIKKEHFGSGPVIVLNEAIWNIHILDLGNDIYSQWRNGDVLPNLINYLRPQDAMILCDNIVLNNPPASVHFPQYPKRYTFECERDLEVNPPACFSHLAALQIAVKIFGCTNLVMMAFDSYRGDTRTVLKDGFVHSEFRPGDYGEQIEIIRKKLNELKESITYKWFFPDEKPIPPNELMRLNLGCGSVYEKGYINIDLHDSRADKIMDAKKLSYSDNEVDEIYSSHLLEHFSKHEVPLVIQEWRRVLKSGGILKLNIPNLEWCLNNFLATNECKKWGLPIDMIYGLQSTPGEEHKTGFTQISIMHLLEHAGFEQIEIGNHWSHNQQCFWVQCKKI